MKLRGDEVQESIDNGGIPLDNGGVPTVNNPITGRTWMDRNLGASQVATSSTDAAAYGDLYQWGRGADGHQQRTSSTTTNLSIGDQPGHGDFILPGAYPNDWRSTQNDGLWQGVDGVNNPCPPGFRIPTSAEWEAERLSWSSNNPAGAFASPLKLPFTGFRLLNGNLYTSPFGGYWSSTVDGINSLALEFDNFGVYPFSERRAYGFACRCIED